MPTIHAADSLTSYNSYFYQCDRLIIKGDIPAGVLLKCTGHVIIHGDVGDGAKVDAGGDLRAQDVGEKATVIARAVHINHLERYATAISNRDSVTLDGNAETGSSIVSAKHVHVKGGYVDPEASVEYKGQYFVGSRDMTQPQLPVDIGHGILLDTEKRIYTVPHALLNNDLSIHAIPGKPLEKFMHANFVYTLAALSKAGAIFEPLTDDPEMGLRITGIGKNTNAEITKLINAYVRANPEKTQGWSR